MHWRKLLITSKKIIMKFLTLFIATFALVYSAYSQTNGSISNVKTDKITLAKTTIVQDSALATFPELVSVVETDDLKSEPSVQKSFGPYSINFYPQPEKGIIYLQFTNLDKNIKPELYLYNSKGDEICKIKAKTRLNIINLREIPSGTYLITADVNKEVSTWEITKE